MREATREGEALETSGRDASRRSSPSSSRRTIRVVLADDHTMFRQGLKEILTTDEEIEVVGEAEHGGQALSLVDRLRPDVLLLDIEMPVMDAYGVMERMKDSDSPPKVVIVTMFENPKLVRELFDLGASAYLTKSASLKELVSTVHNVCENTGGKVTLSVSRDSLKQAREDGNCDLSERELEILYLAARGLTNRRAAAELHLAEATIKRHLANIYQKLGVGSRGEATRKALSEGWISSRDLTRG